MSSTIQVNEQGVELSYLDSGPPVGMSSYRTLIAIHGYGWSADVFEKALPEARKKGIRMIALNRRGFPGSTPFSEEELEPLRSPELDIPKFLTFLRKRGFELFGFIHGVIEKLALPKLAPDGTGNIAVLGWSLGSTYLFTMWWCCNDVDLPASLKKTVKECISSFILFDPSIETCGIRSAETYSSWPEKLFVECQDPNGPIDFVKGAKVTNNFISGWFKYNHASASESADREAFIASCDHPIRPSTIEAAPDAQRFMETMCPSAYESDNLTLLGLTLGAFRVVTLSVLDKAKRQPTKDADQEQDSFPSAVEEDLLSEKKLNWLWCENSFWCCAYNPHIHRKEFGFDGDDPKRKMVSIPDANHFLQWEDPERFIDYVLPLM